MSNESVIIIGPGLGIQKDTEGEESITITPKKANNPIEAKKMTQMRRELSFVFLGIKAKLPIWKISCL